MIPSDPTAGAPGEGPLDAAQIDALLALVELGDGAALSDRLSVYHAADIADFIEQIDPIARTKLIDAIGSELDPAVLSELDETVRDRVLEQLDPKDLSEALKDLDTDDVVYLVEDLDDAAKSQVLDALDEGERVAVEQSLTYPDYSAGRLMQCELVWAPPHYTVGDMIDHMRARDDLPSHFFDIVIVDPTFRPVGMLPLSRVMSSKRPVGLAELMETDFQSFSVQQPQEEVSYAFNQYHMISAPVVDETGRLAGVITIDDAMGALDEEAEEDLLRLGGVGDESLGDAVQRVAWRRAPWLAVNLVTAILASMVIGVYEGEIALIPALAVLMPIVASMGGNAATQTMTVSVRALATKDLTSTNAARIILRELLVGLANGLLFAAVVAVVGAVWFDWGLGGVLAIAMVATLVVAALAGILIPIALDRYGVDPALASGVFVTTVTDVVGFFAFLGIAAALLL